jgi:hypothetical protein
MTKTNGNKIAFILEERRIFVVVLEIKDFYSVRCGWCLNNTARTLYEADKIAVAMLKDALRDNVKQVGLIDKIRELVEELD